MLYENKLDMNTLKHFNDFYKQTYKSISFQYNGKHVYSALLPELTYLTRLCSRS